MITDLLYVEIKQLKYLIMNGIQSVKVKWSEIVRIFEGFEIFGHIIDMQYLVLVEQNHAAKRIWIDTKICLSNVDLK